MSGVGPSLLSAAFATVEAEDVRTWTELEDELDSRRTYQLAYIEDKLGNAILTARESPFLVVPVWPIPLPPLYL
jgi:hypothetical protein